MLPEPGWLDALVDAADAHPEVGGFGAVRVDDEGRVVTHNAGRAEPADAVERWNDTDTTPEDLPSGGDGVRLGDEQGLPHPHRRLRRARRPGPAAVAAQPRGQGLLHAPALPRVRRRPGPRRQAAARGSQSAPTQFRAFLAHWREPWFNERWGELGGGARGALVGRRRPSLRRLALGRPRPGRRGLRCGGEPDAGAPHPRPGRLDRPPCGPRDRWSTRLARARRRTPPTSKPCWPRRRRTPPTSRTHWRGPRTSGTAPDGVRVGSGGASAPSRARRRGA